MFAETPTFAEVEIGRPLFMQVTDQLIAAIEQGSLAIGQALPSEASLGAQFAVSRATVRQALSVLQFNGYVESRRGSGTVVCAAVAQGRRDLTDDGPTTTAELIDLLEARLAIETEAVRMAARDPVPDRLAELEEMVEGMQLAIDADAHSRTDLAIHLATIRVGRNPVVIRAAEALIAQSDGRLWRSIRDRTWDDGQTPRIWLAHHREIVAAVADEDPDRAWAAAGVHLQSVLDNIVTARRRQRR